MAKILVIEDEASLREEIVEWLTFEGYDALGAADGVEGVNAAILHQPDLIVCDISMPRLDGYGVLIDVQGNSTMRSTPFIFLTARAAPDEIRKGMQLGADDYVTKPFDQVDLLRTIQSRLEKKALRETEVQQHVGLFKEMLSHERSQRLFQSKLISMFSHDFHDSLTTIQFANKLLRDFVLENDTTRSIDHIDRIEAHIGQLIQMLDDMLLLGQLESGKFMIEPVPIRLESLLNHITHEFQTLHSTTHEIIFESRFSDIVTADERLLRQIATNLLSNAVKYSPPGSVVRLTLTRYEDRCILIVKDQSIGIPDAGQHEVFDTSPCDSQNETLSENRLELAVVKRAVEAQGGTVTCEHEAGRGSTFTVVLNNVAQ